MSTRPLRPLSPLQPGVTRSEALYRVLLFVYPPRFRRVYGREMVQTFRDSCRDALQQAGTVGLARLWGLVLYDLTITAVSEQRKACISFFKRLLGLQEKEYFMSSNLLNLDVASRTDIGRTRALNEDNVTATVPQDAQVMSKKGALFVVADGMGGHTRGDVASEIAVNTVREAYYQDESDDVATALQHAVQRANAVIYQKNEAIFQGAPKKDESIVQKGMGTTCVAAVLRGDTVYVANAGDSLAYIVRGEQVSQIAQNHSWVAEQVRLGMMSREEAEAQGKGNMITRCLGVDPNEEIYVGSEKVQDGDVLVLCTDGLHNLVSEDEMRTIVGQYGPEESAQRLIARANENGGPDNITAVVVRVSLSH